MGKGRTTHEEQRSEYKNSAGRREEEKSPGSYLVNMVA
jgi:hypothetical protein